MRELKEAIKQGIYPINGRLPDGKTLADDYGVSLMTMKKALDLLVSEGYIIRRRGDGSYIRDWQTSAKPYKTNCDCTCLSDRGQVSIEVMAFELTKATTQVAEKLSLTVDDFVYYVVRKKILDGKVIGIDYSYLPLTLFPNLKREDLAGSLFAYVTDKQGLKIHSSCVKIKGQRPTDLECQEMDLQKTDFLMEIEQVSCLDNCRVFEYSLSRQLPQVFDFETVLFN